MLPLPRTKAGAFGFTLIELMIVVAIIGILAAVVIPKFADMIRKAREGSTKGNLGVVRSALLVYAADNEGGAPNDIVFLVPKYLDKIIYPYIDPYHGQSWYGMGGNGDMVYPCCGSPYPSFFLNGDLGGYRSAVIWENSPPFPCLFNLYGLPTSLILYIDCSHTDSKGTIWSSY